MSQQLHKLGVVFDYSDMPTLAYRYSAVVIDAAGMVQSFYGDKLSEITKFIDDRYPTSPARVFDSKAKQCTATKHLTGVWLYV